MEIINEIRRKLAFKDLHIGDTFMIEGKHYLYMKTLPMSLEDDRPINTIVLNDGSVTYIDEEKETVVVECQLRMVREGW